MDEKIREQSSSSFEEYDWYIPFVKSEAEKNLVRKLNMRLLPLGMTIVYLQVIYLIGIRF